MAPNDFVQQKLSGPVRSAWVKMCFIVLATGIFCLSARGASSTNMIEFAKTLPKPGSVQWEINHRLSQQRQELYRMRVAIPDAESPFVPREASADLINGQKPLPLHLPPPPTPAMWIFNLILFTTMILLTGWLIARKTAPHVLVEISQQLNPWTLAPPEDRDEPVPVRAEEKPFGEFLGAFRAGPAAAAPAETPAEDPHHAFYPRAKERLAVQRKLLEGIRRGANDAALKKALVHLYYEFGALKDEADFPEVLPVWQVASAAEGLLKELTQKIRNVTPSTVRAITVGLEALDKLCVPGMKPGQLTERAFKFLVVDDDLISRQALSLSLSKAFSRPDLAVDGDTALAQTSQHAYDAIFLDVQMPGMDGFELCGRIRASKLNRSTPIIFVTGQSDFDARARSTLSGGNDLMGKPFLIFEVTLNALTHALLARLEADPQNTVSPAEPATAAPEAFVPPAETLRFMSRPVRAGRPPLATPAPGTEPDAGTKAFLNRAADQLAPLRELCQMLLQTTDEGLRQNSLADGFLRLNSLISQNQHEVTHPAYQVCAALEGLIRKLLENARHSTPATLATVAAAVDLLNDLCLPGLQADLATNPPIQLLVVDDDLVARRSLAMALQTTFSKPDSVEGGEAALGLAREKAFDVIFLDIKMPGMDGFEVCSKIRETAPNRATPVVFVTGHADSNLRAQVSRTRGNDLVAKPFLTSEITVKALLFAVRGRLQRNELQPCA